MKSILNTLLRVKYTNWRGVTAVRTITVKDVVVGKNSYHPEYQPLLVVYDHDRKAERMYALKDVQEWFVDE